MAESKRGVVASLLSKFIDTMLVVWLVNVVIASAGLVDWPLWRVAWPLFVIAAVALVLVVVIGVGEVLVRIGGKR